MGLLGGGNAISWTNRAKCPPIEDCAVQNTVKKGRRGRPTKRQVEEAGLIAAAQKAARTTKRGKSAAPEPEPQKKPVWPFVSYDPKRGRGR